MLFQSVHFPNADVINGVGNAQVVRHGFCHFVDGTTNKEWTLGDQLLEYQQGCVCPGELETNCKYPKFQILYVF